MSSTKQKDIDVDGTKISCLNATVILTALYREFPEVFPTIMTAVEQLAMFQDDEGMKQETIAEIAGQLRQTFLNAALSQLPQSSVSLPTGKVGGSAPVRNQLPVGPKTGGAKVAAIEILQVGDKVRKIMGSSVGETGVVVEVTGDGNLVKVEPDNSSLNWPRQVSVNFEFVAAHKRGGGSNVIPPHPPPPSAGAWICQFCKCANASSDLTCVICIEDRPPSLPTQGVSLPSSSANSWTCLNCTFVNETKLNPKACSVCQEYKDILPANPAPVLAANEWACSKCTSVNHASISVCNICNEIRSPRGDKWICASCTTVNDLDRKTCEMCAASRSGVSLPPPSVYGKKPECCIGAACLDPIINWYELPPCKHIVCLDCLRGHVEVLINSREVKNMRCPMYQCKTEISLPMVKEVAGEILFQKMEDYLSEDFMSGTFIHCPTPGCNNLKDWDMAAGTRFDCEMCNQKYCLRCQVEPDTSSNDAAGGQSPRRGLRYSPGHGAFSCAQQREILAKNAAEKKRFDDWKQMNENAEIKFKEMLGNQFKPCPSCNCPIERNQGCDHMTCGKCKCNFCYICGKFNKADPKQRGDCGPTCPNKKK